MDIIEVPWAHPEPGRDDEFGRVGWTLPDAARVLLGWLVITFLIGAVAGTVAGTRPNDAPSVVLLLLFAPPVALVVMTVLLARMRSTDGVRRLVGLKPPSVRDVGAGLIYGVGGALVLMFAVGSLLQALVHALDMRIPPLQQDLHQLATGSAAPLAILLIVTVAPIAEELFFRGMLFQAFERRLGVWSSAALSAAVFSAVHVEPDPLASVIIVVPIFLFGMYLALIFRRRGTIITPVIAHMLFNGLGVLLIRAGTA